MKIFGT